MSHNLKLLLNLCHFNFGFLDGQAMTSNSLLGIFLLDRMNIQMISSSTKGFNMINTWLF